MPTNRGRLSRPHILETAIALADAGGLESLSMRRLGQELGVEAMSLYKHVANKDDLIDGMVDLLFAELQLPRAGRSWKAAMRRRAIDMRQALRRHQWAVGLMESRSTPGVANLRHHDAVIACLLDGGLSIQLTAHAYALIDSYIYGFALQERSLPMETPEETSVLAQEILARFPVDEFPHLARFMFEHVLTPGYHFGGEFEFGLDLILDGIAARARRRS